MTTVGSLDDTPERRYRPCAGAVVFNKDRMVLVGERLDKPGQWQFAQGGLDEGEDPKVAADRELYEEMGLKHGEGDITYVSTLEETMTYDVPPGTWLEKAGFVGQRMHWSMYSYDGTGVPTVNLEGLGGEKPEFNQTKWISWEELCSIMVGFKSPVYERLREVAVPHIEAHLASVQ